MGGGGRDAFVRYLQEFYSITDGIKGETGYQRGRNKWSNGDAYERNINLDLQPQDSTRNHPGNPEAIATWAEQKKFSSKLYPGDEDADFGLISDE